MGCSKTQEQRAAHFFKRAAEVHGDDYDYSDAVYEDSFVKILIKCNDHGDFYQTPASHLRGRGCPACGKIKKGKKKRTSLEEHLKRFYKKHKDLYDYSKIPENFTANQLLPIVCKIHGNFLQSAEVHYRSGCPKCCGKNKNNEEVVAILRETHGDLYDYSKVSYQGAHTKLIVGCSKHGEFRQSFSNHRNGHGCPECALEDKNGFFLKKELVVGKNGYLYVILLENEIESFIKVGITARPTLSERLWEISSETTYDVSTLYSANGDLWDIYQKEQKIHKKFSAYKHIPSIKFGGYTECYSKKALQDILEEL